MSTKPARKIVYGPERDALLAECTKRIRYVMSPAFDPRAYHLEQAKIYRAQAAERRAELGETLRAARADMNDEQWRGLIERSGMTLEQAEAYMLGLPEPVAPVAAPAPEPQRAGRRIYFIQGVAGGAIKIGVSEAPRRRLADLQVGSPVVLRIIGTALGDQRRETALHRKLAKHRLHGEWFADSPEVRAAIAEVLA